MDRKRVTSRSPAGTGVAPFARAPVLLTAAVVACAHLALAALPRSWSDEDLMLAIGRHHLDWGSADQPPVVPLLARLADSVAPGSGTVLALPAVAATAVSVVLVALLTRELGGDRRAQCLAALAQATAPVGACFGHWLTPASLEAAQWLTICWLLVRWVRLRDDRLLLVLGVVVGVAVQTKFQATAFAAVLLVSVVAVGPRTLLRRPALWAGAVLAALIAAPTLLWQAVHGWPQLRMAGVVSDEASALQGGPLLTALMLIVWAGVPAVALMAVGLVELRRDEMRELRFLGVTFVVLLVVFALSSGRFYYLAGLYGALGAVGLQRRREAGRPARPWGTAAAATAGVVGAAGVLSYSTELASPVFADALVPATTRAYDALPEDQRARTVIVGSPYVYSAILDAAPPGTGLPPTASPNRSYGWFEPPAPGIDEVLLVGDPATLRPWFSDVRPVGHVATATPTGSYVPTTVTLWRLSGRTASWTTIWADARSLRLG